MNIKNYLLFALVSVTAHSFAQQLPVELQTPEIVEVNRMPMRAQGFAFENAALAEKRTKENSKFFKSLNGTWKFNWVQDPRKRPTDFYKEGFDDSKWDNFKVPANWEVNGYGTPIYVNQPYEFAGRRKTGARMDPPFDIPEDNNPVGSYRKKFNLPDDWDGRQVFIHLGAVKSAFFIWVNGKKVGYSEDSKLAAEFDITKYVKKGENTVALQVYRWSDASYLECQDMFRISGIERDVYLYSTPKLDIRDFKVISTLDKQYKNGVLSVWAEVNSYIIDKKTLHSKPEPFKVGLLLVDANGKKIYSDKTTEAKTVLGNYKTELNFNTIIPDVKQWSAEKPALYTLYLSLENGAGEVLEVIPVRVGFRSVELKDKNFLVNGKRVFLKGVNRHEHHPQTGHTLTHDNMRKDIEMMKKLNVNAVRCSHYPDDPYWLELCNEYGLYVVDEANIESHGRYYDLEYTLGNDKKWRNAHMARILRMYERDKNNPSIVTWSLGNEAGNGTNFYAAYDWLKAHDGRPVQYERAEEDANTDMIVPQYPDPDWLAQYSKSNPDRALIMSEYAHIMGNSLGNFQEYWDVIETYPYLQGGFIWEWIDQGIDTVRNGKRFLAYGGDFPLAGPVDQNFSDNNFCVKGVVTGYRDYTPMAREVKKVYQHIKTKIVDINKGVIEVKNGYFFRDLSNYYLDWTLLEDGKVLENGKINELNIAPQEAKELNVKWRSALKPGKEYYLNVVYRLKTDEPFLPKDFDQAYEQFKIGSNAYAAVKTQARGALKVNQTDKMFVIQGSGFKITFDLIKGALTNYEFKGEQLIKEGPQPGFWRAPTDNDIGAGFNRSLRSWRDAGKNAVLKSAKVNKISEGEYELVVVKDVLNGDANYTQTYRIKSDGSIVVDNQFKAIKGAHKLLMRMGNDLVLNKTLENVKWYGRGPWENYWDRKTSALVGLYQQKVKDQYFPYARPQESGNKADVRWVSLTNNKGIGLKVVMADSLLNFAALPYNMDDLDPEVEKKQYHSGELNVRPETYFHIDLQQMGLQGIDSWGSAPLKQYRLLYKDYRYSYTIEPIR